MNNIWKKIIDDEVFIIAEIGKNFIQSADDKSVAEYLANAKALIKSAKESGADAVKFQTHNYEDEQLNAKIFAPHFPLSDRYAWVKRNTEATPLEFWRELKKYSYELGIIFFSTPMSRGAAEKLNQAGVDLWKVGSGDLLDFALIDYLASTKKPIIISSGMSTLKEVDLAVDFLKKRTDQVVLMHCVSKYPAKPEDLNLKTIEFLQKRYKLPVGFSDHSLGHDSALAAVKLGAGVIEKHFSSSRDHWGSDHKVSMTPAEFKRMVDGIRKKEEANIKNYGRSAKVLQRDEAAFRPVFRKSLVAARNIKAGEVITPEMLYALRPQVQIGGLPSEEYENILGKAVSRDLAKYEPIRWEDIKQGKKRKVCFIITSKIHYSRNKLIMEELRNREDVELQIVVGASAILDNYGDVLSLLKEDGFECSAKILMTIEGGNSIAMAKTAGMGIIEFTTVFENLSPDLVVVRGDRYEILSAAIAAAYLNIPVAHIEGGDLSGTIDESVRHAVTKLAHVHFATNEESKKRILRLGENPDYVFNFGSPDLEMTALNNFSVTNEFINSLGVGDEIDILKPYLIVMQHSVTSETSVNRLNIEKTLRAVEDLKIPAVVFWPNNDAGTDEISDGIRSYRENVKPKSMRFIKYLPPEEFLGLLKGAACLVGNSSAGIKECSFLGVPAVNIGSRQNGRLRAENVVDVGYDQTEIKNAITKQLEHGRYESSHIYYQAGAGQKIAEVLATIKLYIQKKFFD